MTRRRFAMPCSFSTRKTARRYGFQGLLGLRSLALCFPGLAAVADSALYTAQTLKELGDFPWISRVPESIGGTQSLCAMVDSDWMESRPDRAYTFGSYVVTRPTIKHSFPTMASAIARETESAPALSNLL